MLASFITPQKLCTHTCSPHPCPDSHQHFLWIGPFWAFSIQMKSYHSWSLVTDFFHLAVFSVFVRVVPNLRQHFFLFYGWITSIITFYWSVHSWWHASELEKYGGSSYFNNFQNPPFPFGSSVFLGGWLFGGEAFQVCDWSTYFRSTGLNWVLCRGKRGSQVISEHVVPKHQRLLINRDFSSTFSVGQLRIRTLSLVIQACLW